MNNKIISSIVVGLLISITFGTCVLVDTNSNFAKEYMAEAGYSTNSLKGAAQYWAVIVGISDYYNGSGSDLPSPALDAKRLDIVLKLKSDEWNSNNILLLSDSDANRQNILDALDWLEKNADGGDTVMFFFSGHGTRVVDQDGDEEDGFDEVICPYDYDVDFVNYTPTNPVNFITDDELSEKFDDISAKGIKGMFIIFNSCFSGGLVDWKDEQSAAKEETNLFDALKDANAFDTGLSSDIESENRVILTGSLPFTLGEEFFGYLSFGKAIGRAFQLGKKTAEDISHFAKKWWLGKPAVIRGLLMGILSAPSYIALFKEYGLGFVFAFPYPMIKDNYPSDKPLSEKLQIIS